MGFFRQGIGAAFFIWFFVSYLEFDYLGVWLGAVVSVIVGCMLSVSVAYRVYKSETKLYDFAT